MPIQRTYTFDLQGKEVCGLLCAKGEGGSSSYTQQDEILKTRIADGYDPAQTASRPLPGSQRNLKFPIYGTRSVKLTTTQGRLVGVYPVEDFGIADVRLTISAVLSTRVGIDPVLKAEIIKTFETTPLNMADVDNAETAMIRAGADIHDYWIDLSINLVRGPYVIGRDRVDQFNQLMSSARDAFGRKIYIVEELNGLSISCESAIPALPSDHVIEIMPGDDHAKVIQERERAKQDTCDGLVVTDEEIGTAFLIPELMLRWDLVDIVVCGKKIGSMHVPYLFKRQRPAVLHGIFTSLQDAKNYYEDQFRDCIVACAITTGVLAIVTGFGSLAAAAASFQTALALCVKQKITKTLPCLAPDLQLVVEDRPWVPV